MADISPRHWLIVLAIFVGVAVILFAMERSPICTCGFVKLWEGEVNSAGNSQHIADWYTPGHMIRDNLTLNILMLIYPLEAIKLWQGGG